MAAQVPLYEVLPLAPVEIVHPRAHDPGCTRCALAHGPRKAPVAPAGLPGGVLFVGEKPGRHEDNCGEPQTGPTGSYLREQVAKHYDGPSAYDNAVRCLPRGSPTPAEIEACRCYLADSIQRAKPTRIICLGADAVLAVLGRSVAPYSARRGHGWIVNPREAPGPDGLVRPCDSDADPVPVFMVIHPAAAGRNRFVRRWFESDLKWALTVNLPKPTVWWAMATPVRGADEARDVLRACRAADWTSVDCETSGITYNADFSLLSVALTPKGQEGTWVFDREALVDPTVRALLSEWMADPVARKVGQAVKADARFIRCGLGVPLRGVVGDTRLWRKLLDADADAKLDAMAELVGMGGMKDESVAMMASAGRAKKRTAEGQVALLDDTAAELAAKGPRYAFGALPSAVLTRRNARDAVSTARLAELFQPAVNRETALRRVWERLVLPANEAVEQVEAWGMPISRDAIRATEAFLRLKQEEVWNRLAPYQFNPDSPADVANLFYERLKLPVVKVTSKGGRPSTDKEAMEALEGKHPVVADLRAFRRLKKLRGTYACGTDEEEGGLEQHIREDGRCHPTLNLDGARTGRLSCEEPNLQNIPRAQTEEGRMIRNAFRAAPGYVLLEADYSQLELRVAAMLSGDEEMKKIFVAGHDYHRRTAEMVARTAWGVDPAAVEDAHRSKAKEINFGLMFGMSDGALSKRAKCSVAEAARIRAAVLGKFRRLDEYTKERLEEARRTGCVWTYYEGMKARRRPLWRVLDEDGETRATAEHGSWNTPIQGTASDFCLGSLVRCVRWIFDDAVPARLIVTVHDSLLFEVRLDALAEVAWQVRRLMTQGWETNGVPLVVDLKSGDAWGSLEKYREAA